MIVDCHTKIWDSNAQLGRAGAAWVVDAAQVNPARHWEAINPVDRAIVLGFKSRYLEAEIPNRFLSEYVRRYSSKMVGFAGIDPTEPNCLDELRLAQEELHLKGVTISPALQNFHPTDTRAMRVYEACMRRGMPIVFEHNLRNPAAKMEFGRPMPLDEVAREFPELRFVIAHMGHPWIEETLVLLSKHPHVFADVAGLLRQPWLTYNALLRAHEYGVMSRLLFGSDFPFRSPAACIESLYSVNQIAHGTNLVPIPREQLRGIVERDTLQLLGIEKRPAPPPKAAPSTFSDEE